VGLFATGVLVRRSSTPLAAPQESNGLRPATLVVAGVCLAILLARAWLHPLPGYDMSFRWGRLAELVARTHHLDFYPPHTPAQFELYFYPDAIPPMVSLVYAELYSQLGHVAPEATAWFIGLQGVLLAGLAAKLARLWAGVHAVDGAMLALCATPLLFWAVLMGQETGLTALSLGAMLYWLHRSGATGRSADAAFAGLAAGLGAASREYACAFALLGLAIALWLGLGWRRTLLYVGCCAIVAVPWYLRVWALTGNPFYPLKLGNLFPYDHVHDGMFADLRTRYAWSALSGRERVRTLGTILQLAPLAVIAGSLGLIALRRRSPALIISVVGVVALWFYGLSVVSGGTYISLRMLSPAFLLLAAAAGVALASVSRPALARLAALCAVLLTLPNLLTMPLMAKSVPLTEWFDSLRSSPATAEASPAAQNSLLALHGRILTDNAYLHAQFGFAGQAARVVPAWSPEFAFLFQSGADPREQLRRLRDRGVETVVLGSDSAGSGYIARQPWAVLIRQTSIQVLPGCYRIAPEAP
jgi:hypothetical protein